jgi:hypothetical protein
MLGALFRGWLERIRPRPAASAPAPSAPTPIPAALEAARRDCWFPVVEPLEDDAAASKFGGVPLTPAGSAWPACGNCHQPLALFVQVDSGHLPPEAGRPFGDGVLQVFYCLSKHPCCEVDAQAYFPFSPATLVRVLGDDVVASGPASAAKPPFYTGRITSWRRAEDYPNDEEQGALGITLPEAILTSVADVYPRAGAKLGGWPAWVQGIEYPTCRTCSQPMSYVLQIDSDDHIPYMFGDAGCGHVFRCDRHPGEMTFGWACS